MSVITAKDKVRQVREFERRYVYRSRSGEFRNITVRTFWTKEGRRRILRDLKRRLSRLISGFDCSYQITLTYRDFCDYDKGDIRRFMRSFTDIFRKLGISYKYFWVAEIQKRGMIHYHILIFVKSSDRPKVFHLFDKERINRLWGKGYTFITFSRKTLKKAFNYASKYLLKTVKSDNDFYLELVLFFKEFAGSFRLYGMSQIRRFKRGVRKRLLAQYHANNVDERNNNWLESGLEVELYYWPQGAWCRRTGKVVHRYCDLRYENDYYSQITKLLDAQRSYLERLVEDAFDIDLTDFLSDDILVIAEDF